MAKKTLLNAKPKELLRQYSQELKKAQIPVEKLILFGSYAKGKPKPWSDLDVCVVSKKFGKNSFREMVRLSHIAARVDSLIEAHPYHPRDLKDKWDPLASEIRQHGVAVFP